MTRITLRIDFDDAHQVGPGKIKLLELINEQGSISAASRLMGMSYRRAWTLMVSLNATFAEPLITARAGGSGGGSAELTAKGHEVVRCYRAIEANAVAAAAVELRILRKSLAPSGRKLAD